MLYALVLRIKYNLELSHTSRAQRPWVASGYQVRQQIENNSTIPESSVGWHCSGPCAHITSPILQSPPKLAMG